MQEIYEKAGLFYLGKDVEPEHFQTNDSLTLVKNKWLTTHAVIVGMTGSGKTGLGIGLIEEAALDNIPVVVIDPKGDMTNLCLTDPEFSSETFKKWVRQDAEAKGEPLEEAAKKRAAMWKEGIEKWHQDSERVARFHQVQKRIYTPGSSAGLPVNILSSLEVPPSSILDEPDTYASYLKSTVTGLLSLIGEATDAIDSPAYILTAKIISDAWREGNVPTIETLISSIVSPPFKSVGVMPIEHFFSKKERFKLANRFNALLASPGFELWMEGDTLDMQSMLYDETGKARIAIFSIAHLNDDERMFFVTLLLNRYIAWMRRQSGTSRLKAMLYMDEIFGFFPPNANPPSKEPMLLLLKQARAFGTGIVLSTQNPVDLDYKGLSNIGTWFIGRLQTKQDINRIIDGVEGKIGTIWSKADIERMLTGLKSRIFLLKSIHMEQLRLFSTRWVMSYLKGPLTRDEIEELTAPYKEQLQKDEKKAIAVVSNDVTRRMVDPLDESIPVYYEAPLSLPANYNPTLEAHATVRFFNQRKGIDLRKDMVRILPLDAHMTHISWDKAYEDEAAFARYLRTPPQEANFGEIPSFIRRDKGLKRAIRELKDYLYANEKIEMWRCRKLKMESMLDETYGAFVVRVQDKLAELKEEQIEKLQARYEKKEKILQERIAKAQERVEKEKDDATSSLLDTGIAILGALFGRATPTKLGRTLSKGTKVLKERGDISRAQERLERLLETLEEMEMELEEKIDALQERFSIEAYPIETLYITPRKSDIDVDICALVWKN
jgi:DNA-binding ferritin-like protein